MAGKVHRSGAAKRRMPKRPPNRKAPVEQDGSKREIEGEQGFLFDPYWDDAFSAYYDPTLRTCCQLKY